MLKDKKKERKDRDIKPEPEPLPSPRLPGEEDDWDEINRDDKDRIPVPPGEEPPLPIHAPTQPGHKAPVYA